MRRATLHIHAALAWLAVLGIGGLGLAQEDSVKAPKAGGAENPPRFVRTHAPADRIAEWPRDGVGLFSVKAAEFEQLLRSASAGDRAEGAPPTACVTSGLYAARFDGQALVDGRGLLRVVHADQKRTYLSLDPCRLAIARAGWGEEGRQPALLGLAPDGKLGVLVEQSDELHLDWSARGRRDRNGEVRFLLELPPSPSNRLLLTLPPDRRPVAERAVVFREPGPREALPEWLGRWLLGNAAQGDSAPAQWPGRWRLELGGCRRLDLRIVPQEASLEPPYVVLSRQTTAYDVSMPGVDVEAEVELASGYEVPRRVEFVLAASLRVLGAESAGSPVAWELLSPDDQGLRRVALDVPAAAGGGAVTVKLRAFAPLESDGLWRLPEIRPQGAVWESSRSTLRVEPPLTLRRVVLSGSRQIPTADPSDPSEQVFAFQDTAADGSVEVEVVRREERITADVLSAVHWSGAKMTAEVGIRLTTRDGERFALEAEVRPGWAIDAVESVDAELPAGTELLDNWSQVPTSGGASALKINLAEPLAADRPLRLRIVAHRLDAPVDRELLLADLQPLLFPESVGGNRWIAVRAAAPYELNWAGTETVAPVVVGPDSGGAWDYLSLEPDDLILPAGKDSSQVKVSLERREPKPQYDALIHVEAKIESGSLRETVRLRCAPRDDRVGRILVRVSPVRGELPVGNPPGPPASTAERSIPWKWTLGPQGDERLTATRLPSGDKAPPGNGSTEERWVIDLGLPRSGEFTVHATRQFRLDSPTVVCLASMPEAVSQQGVFEVRSVGGSGARIENHWLTPIPSEPALPGRQRAASMSFRYDPAGPQVLGPRPPATIYPSTNPAVATAWVWDLQLRSRYAFDGRMEHVATYRVQNAGADALCLELPPELAAEQVHEASIDGAEVAWQASEDGDGRCVVIPLPRRQEYPTVSLRFSTAGPGLGEVRHNLVSPSPADLGSAVQTLKRRLGSGQALEPVVPEPTVPVLGRHWTVWLPPGVEVTADVSPPRQGGGMAKTWTQRLFGPLGRPAGSRPFDPVDETCWRWLLPDTAADADRAMASAFLAHLGQLVDRAGFRQGNGTLTWGTLLAAAAAELPDAPVLIDAEGLRWSGLTADTVLGDVRTEVAPEEEAAARGARWLARNGLAVLAGQNILVITTHDEVGLLGPELVPLDWGAAWRIRPGPYAEQVREAASRERGKALLPVQLWCDLPGEAQLPWRHSGPGEAGPAAALGWTAHRVAIRDGVPTRLGVYHRPTFAGLGWIVFLAVLGVASWLFGRRPAALAAMSVAAATAALLVPEVYSAVASGAVLGLLGSILVALMRRRRIAATAIPAETDAKSDGSSVGAANRASLLLWASLAGLAVDAATAAQPPPKAAAANKPPLYRVFIPVDENNQPSGDEVYVPEPFYRELHRRKETLTQEPSWLLANATYRATLTFDAAQRRMTVGDLRAVFDLHVLRPSGEIRIPMPRGEALLKPEGATLDGRAIEVDWASETPWLGLAVPQPGQYRLELAIVPPTPDGEGRAGFDLAIPPVAQSRLELRLPAGAPAVDVRSALGVPTVEDGGRRLVADLGPQHRLEVRWQDPADRAASAASDVVELWWLRLKPGFAALDVRYEIAILQGRIERLELALDPNLRLFSVQVNGRTVALPEITSGGGRSVKLELPQGFEDQSLVAEARFIVDPGATTGVVRLPRLQSPTARPVGRYLAVNVDPRLRYAEEPPTGARPMAAADFADRWGSGETEPEMAFEVGQGTTSVSLARGLSLPTTTADQAITLGFDQNGAEVLFDAALTTTGGDCFEYRLSAPEGLKISNIELVHQEQDLVRRWARDRSGTVTLFLSAPVTGSQQLRLQGRLPIRSPSPLPLPLVRVEDADVVSETIDVFRQSACRVRLDGIRGLIPVDRTTVEPAHSKLGRRVASFFGDGDEIQGTVTLAANQPDVTAVQVSSLRREEDAWRLEITTWLRVKGEGLVDALRFDLPADWQSDFRTDDDATLSMVRVPGTARRQLVVRPSAPIRDETRLTISSLLPPTLERVPPVVLRGTGSLRQYLVLPKTAGQRPVAWDTQGLRKRRLPRPLAPATEDPSVATYEVTEEPFQARLRTPEPERGDPQILLRDVFVAWEENGSQQAVGVFDVEPAGADRCWLQLPGGCRLIAIRVGDAPMPLAAAEEAQRRWLLPLRSRHLPQRIEVVYAGSASDGADRPAKRLEAPWLAPVDHPDRPLPAKQTLWTVVHPPGFSVAEAEGHALLSAPEQEFVRLHHLTALLRTSPQRAAEAPRDPDRWYRLWARRWAASESRLARELSGGLAPTDREAAVARLAALRQAQEEIARQRNAADGAPQIPALPAVADGPVPLWRGSFDRHPARTLVISTADEPFLLIRQAPHAPSRFSHEPAAALGLGAVVLIWIAVAFRSGGLALLRRWPRVTGVVVGLAWWLWLQPSILGWGIVFLCLLTVRRVKPGPQEPASSSTIAVYPRET